MKFINLVLVVVIMTSMLGCSCFVQQDIEKEIISSAGNCPWVENYLDYYQQPIEPCLIYETRIDTYTVQGGDYLYGIFGCVGYTDVLVDSLGTDNISPKDRFDFYSCAIQDLHDIKYTLSVIDSLSDYQVETLMVVIRNECMAYLVVNSRNEFCPDKVIWSTWISTGKRHHDGGGPTPTGLFQIVQQKEKHWSAPYECWMPYAHRLGYTADTTDNYVYRTWWSPWWVHEGYTTGSVASHGCVRLPRAWAISLWEILPKYTYVLIVDEYQLCNYNELIGVYRQSEDRHHRMVSKKRRTDLANK